MYCIVSFENQSIDQKQYVPAKKKKKKPETYLAGIPLPKKDQQQYVKILL